MLASEEIFVDYENISSIDKVIRNDKRVKVTMFKYAVCQVIGTFFLITSIGKIIHLVRLHLIYVSSVSFQEKSVEGQAYSSYFP